jgi:hypothetical protein
MKMRQSSSSGMARIYHCITNLTNNANPATEPNSAQATFSNLKRQVPTSFGSNNNSPSFHPQIIINTTNSSSEKSVETSSLYSYYFPFTPFSPFTGHSFLRPILLPALWFFFSFGLSGNWRSSHELTGNVYSYAK